MYVECRMIYTEELPIGHTRVARGSGQESCNSRSYKLHIPFDPLLQMMCQWVMFPLAWPMTHVTQPIWPITQCHSTVKPGTHWRQSRLLPKPATNRQQSRLSSIRSTLLPVLATNRQQLEVDSLSRSTLLPIGQLCCRYGRICRQCVLGQSNMVDDFRQSRPCWMQHCRQCVPGFIVVQSWVASRFRYTSCWTVARRRTPAIRQQAPSRHVTRMSSSQATLCSRISSTSYSRGSVSRQSTLSLLKVHWLHGYLDESTCVCRIKIIVMH